MANRLQGRVAIITGAGQGIGEACAKAYAAEGARVLITGRTLSKLEQVAAQIREAGGEVICMEALAGNRQHAEAVVERAISTWGRVDVLVNNAHTFTDSMAMEDPTLEEHIRVNMDTALIGSLQLMQCVFPYMRDAGAGSIINFGSSFGLRCEPGYLAYAASKEAIRTLTKTAAREWGKYRIRVNTVLPSALTPKARWYLEETGSYELEAKKTSYGVIGEPGDIAPSLVFLASDESSYITGQTLGVDAGSTML